jgi:hypothetical protein
MALWIPVAWLALGMTVPLSGTVVDAAGQPVAGATVWLGDTIATRQGPEVLATAETDDRGNFRLERAEDLAGRGNMWSPTLWAYKPGSRVASIEFKGNLPGADEPVRLALGPPASTPVRVLQADGKPAKGVRVRLIPMAVKVPRPPDKLLDRLATTTDADGRVTLDGFAIADLSALDVTVEGQVVQSLPIDRDTGTVTLRPLGRLKARIVADDPKALPGWTITASSRPTEPGYQGPFRTHWARKTTGEDGQVEFPPLAEGQVLWEIKPPEGLSFLVEKQPSAAIRAGDLVEVAIPVRRGIRVEGAVREEPGGAPIPGVKVDVATLRTGSRTVEWIATDSRGRFSTLVLPGTVRFSFSVFDMPKDYFLPPGTQHWLDFEVKEGEKERECTPPPLRKAAQVRGRVMNEAGEPAAGVTVMGSWNSAEYGRNPNTIHAVTDARGEFILGSIAPKAAVSVSATRGRVASSVSLTVPSAGEGEPITLRLKKRPSVALTGRVLGADGQPLVNAVVRVKIRPPRTPNVSYGGGPFVFEGLEEIRTGPDGRYRTPDQLPIGNEFRVEAEAPGYELSVSSWLSPPDVEVPALTLRRSIGSREVAGRVVDSAGKPVTGAEVFQSGDGPKKTRSLTVDDGRFQVPGLPATTAFLFVSREGYHFVGRRVEPGERSVELALRRLDEPPPAPLRTAAPLVPRDEERALARTLVAETRKAPGGNFEVPDRQRLPEISALVDPDRVIEMIGNQVVQVNPDLVTALTISRYEEGPQKTFEFLDALKSPYLTSVAALGLFDRLGATAPPGFRCELLDRAERWSRELNASSQSASNLARIADRWFDLGDFDRGAKLAREAQSRAEALTQAQAGNPRGFLFPDPGDDLALALARVDLPSALKRLEGPGKNSYQLSRLRTGIAQRIAATNLAEARRIVGLIQDDWQRSARRVACFRMAAKDLPAARALAAEDHDPMVEALLPAIAARARAESDPNGARALLRESVERLRKLGESTPGQPSPAVALARLLPLAARIDPDRAPDDFWLALARRPPLMPLPDPAQTHLLTQVRQQYLDRAELAVLVARYDRAAAEVVFAPVAARLVSLSEERWGLGREGPALFRAAGAFDAQVARSLLDALPEDPAPPAGQPTGVPGFRHHSKAEARLALARTLGLPPALRLREPFPPDVWANWFEDLDD